MIEVARGAQTRDPAVGCQSGNHANFPQIFSKCGDGARGGDFGENHSFASVGRLGGLLIRRGSGPVPESPMDDWERIALAM